MLASVEHGLLPSDGDAELIAAALCGSGLHGAGAPDACFAYMPVVSLRRSHAIDIRYAPAW